MADVPIYIVHLSAAEALEMVTEARDRGLPAYAETCPQYLFLSADNYEEPGFEGAKYVMSPPFAARTPGSTCGAGSHSATCGNVATDHCPFCMKEQKELGQDDFSKIPNGAPGIETRMSFVPRRRATQTPRSTASSSSRRHRPRRSSACFRAGTIAPGSDADIVVFDPDKKIRLSARTLHMKVDYNPTRVGRSPAQPTRSSRAGE